MKDIIDPHKKKLKYILGVVLVVLFVLPFISRFWVTVEAGHTGVQNLFGRVYDEELSSGFHLKNPLVNVTPMSIRTQEYTMSKTRGEGARYSEDSITALTKEGLQVDLDMTILFHLKSSKASDVYRDLGANYVENVIRPAIRSTIREKIANYEAKSLYSEKREEARKQIFDSLQKMLEPRGVELEDVLLRNVKLPSGLAQSIEEKLQAEQESEKYDFLLQKEEKEAERKRIEARGQRDAQQIINQGLTNQYLKYQYIKNLKEREGTIYVPTSPNNGVPMFRGL